MLTWNDELLNKMTFNTFGTRSYNEIRFKIAKRMHQVETGQLPMQHGKEKERWMVETETSEESSGFWTSHDEEDAHIRKDGGSSADEENTLKDFVRRNAKEERDFEKKAKDAEGQRVIDMKLIEKLRFEKLPIPQKFIHLYGDELTEANYNFPNQIANFNHGKEGLPTASIDQPEKALSKTDRIRLQLIK